MSSINPAEVGLCLRVWEFAIQPLRVGKDIPHIQRELHATSETGGKCAFPSVAESA